MYCFITPLLKSQLSPSTLGDLDTAFLRQDLSYTVDQMGLKLTV